MSKPGEMMIDDGFRKIDGARMSQHTPGQVGVLKVHKDPVIKTSYFS
jgi:hypothetical protein